HLHQFLMARAEARLGGDRDPEGVARRLPGQRLLQARHDAAGAVHVHQRRMAVGGGDHLALLVVQAEVDGGNAAIGDVHGVAPGDCAHGRAAQPPPATRAYPQAPRAAMLRAWRATATTRPAIRCTGPITTPNTVSRSATKQCCSSACCWKSTRPG